MDDKEKSVSGEWDHEVRPDGDQWTLRRAGHVVEVLYDTDSDSRNPGWIWRGAGEHSICCGGGIADSREDAMSQAEAAVSQ